MGEVVTSNKDRNADIVSTFMRVICQWFGMILR